MLLWRSRVLCFYAVISIITIVFFLVTCLPTMFIKVKYRTRYNIAMWFSYIFVWSARIMCSLKYKVEGLEKLPKEPCIVMSNHQSFWENVFMQLIIPEHSWVIKKELFEIPFFGWGLKMVEPIAVNRNSNGSVNQILEQGKKKIKNGLWLVVFPESTRLRPEQSMKFKPSAAKLAIEAKVPIVLIAHNAGVFWPKGFWIKKPGVINVKIIEVLSREFVETQEVRTLTEHIGEIINVEKQKLYEAARDSIVTA